MVRIVIIESSLALCIGASVGGADHLPGPIEHIAVIALIGCAIGILSTHPSAQVVIKLRARGVTESVCHCEWKSVSRQAA